MLCPNTHYNDESHKTKHKAYDYVQVGGQKGMILFSMEPILLLVINVVSRLRCGMSNGTRFCGTCADMQHASGPSVGTTTSSQGQAAFCVRVCACIHSSTFPGSPSQL